MTGGGNDEDVTLTDVACYCAGTSILTDRGEVGGRGAGGSATKS